jgi:phospholipid transport system substrate-binding protein
MLESKEMLIMRVSNKWYLCIFSLFFLQVFTYADTMTPHQIIESKTQTLISLVQRAKENKDGSKGFFYTNPNKYYAELSGVIDPIVDFPTFTRGVMGRYGTSDYYRSLKSKEEKTAFKKNYRRFVKEFKQGLMQTYGKGMMAFNGQTSKVMPATEADKKAIANGKMVSVRQIIINQGKEYEVIFKMRPDRSGSWILRNIIIDKINIGDLYKKQFESAMAKYQGNFSTVVDRWLVDMDSQSKK